MSLLIILYLIKYQQGVQMFLPDKLKAANKVFKNINLFFFCFLLLCNSLVHSQPPKSSVKHPAWSYNKSIYEVNIRQFSQEGTLKAVEKQLPRLKEMGVGIVWLMPIHPIGEKNRKGSLGSYYSVKDYYGISPDYGTMDDLKSLVKETHKLGMYIIIDWVANHTSWDNALVKEHPEFFTKDSNNNFVPPVADWSDVIDLNYDNKGLWTYMVDALKYWVKEADIDGYRCDVAGMVPLEFWNYARTELDKLRPVFMLAEWEDPGAHIKAFDMTYGWDLHHIFNETAQGKKTAIDIKNFFIKDRQKYPADAFRMNFISNHDENSWNGTEFERMGAGANTFFVLAATAEGMPLVYNGQEAPLKKRLDFFEKDPIDWNNFQMKDFYTKLLTLKNKNKALLNGVKGGKMQFVSNGNNNVFAFTRMKGNYKVLVILNLSKENQDVTLTGKTLRGSYAELFSNGKKSFKEKESLKLKPWEYRVYVK